MKRTPASCITWIFTALQNGAAELEALGYRDLRALPGLVIVEWPERAGSALGTADLHATLSVEDPGRRLVLVAATDPDTGGSPLYRVAL